jgi:predicted amidophosphoribosyltransferase
MLARAPRTACRDDTIDGMDESSSPAWPGPPHPLIRSAFSAAWALVAPVECVGCGHHDVVVCDDCAAGLVPNRHVAALAVGNAAVPLVAGLAYDGVARRALLAFKEEGRTELARWLAPAVDAAVVEAYRQAARYGASRRESPLLVAVPGSYAGLARRGVTPTDVLLRAAGLHATRALSPARSHGPAQKARRLDERLARDRTVVVRGAERLLGRRVVLLDDVVTSGATLQAAAAALRAVGAEVVACAAVMATLRRSGTSRIPWASP